MPRKRRKQIAELSDEQAALLPQIRDEWRHIGLNTAPVDHKAAEAAVIEAYRRAKLDPPKTQMRVASPSAGAALLEKLREEKRLGAPVGFHLGPQLGRRATEQIVKKTGVDVWSQIIVQIRRPIETQTAALIQAQNDILAQTRRTAPAFPLGVQTCHGCHDAGWLSYFAAYNQLFGLAEEASGLLAAARRCGWWWPFTNICLISDRPKHIQFDAENRPHCETGPAIRYRDGFSVYAWRGQQVPSAWIEHPESLTARTALTWPQIEQRRAACEILGWPQILDALNGVEIDANPNPEIGVLIEVELPDIGKEKFLRVRCGTGREFALPVPPGMRSARQAQAWTWGLEEDEFLEPEVRT